MQFNTLKNSTKRIKNNKKELKELEINFLAIKNRF